MNLNNEFLELIKKYRRDFHRIPELGFELYKTSDYLKNQLISMGYEPVTVAKTGIVVVKKGKENDAIAFRSDMDGLPVEEKTNVDFVSVHHGMMHACGHDGHMAILLGFAKYLTTIPILNNTIVLIFQPAEESPGGAKVIIQEGILKRYNVKTIFGLHLYPGLEEGKIGLVDKAMMAQSGEFDVTIEGRSSHGAEPHLGSDAILATSTLINNYQSIISRNLDPLAPAVLTVGTINGGEARNIIANKVTITGTIRSFDTLQYEFIKQRINEINNSLEIMHNVKVKCEIRDFYPPVINDSSLFQQVKSILNNDDFKIIKPLMFSEDFSYYQKEIPGLFAMLGTKNEENAYINPLHSCYFNFSESILVKGINYYINILKL